MEQKHQDDLAKVLIFSGDSHVTEYDASRLKNEIKFTNTLQNITTLLEAQRPELPTYNLQKPKNYNHFHVDLKNVKSVLLKNKSNDKYAVILYRDNTIKNNYRFNFLQLQNKMATVCRLNKSAKKVKNEDHTSIKIYTNKKYLNNVSSKRKTPHNIRNNTNSEYKLKKILQKQLQNEKNKHFCANAIFDLKKIHQKVILSREIENGNDIQKFVKNVRHFNNSSIVKWRQKMVKKLTSLNIELRKILIIIQINNFTSKMYLNMGKQTPKFKNAHKINNTHFVNIKMLNIKLQNVKKIDRKVNKKAKSDLSPILSETDLVAKHSTRDLTDELKGATFKEMCRILLKLQSKSRVECKKLYSHYSAFKMIAFNEEIFEIVHKIVCKFSTITRAQQNANIELVNLGYSLRNAVRSFEKEQSPAIKSIILKKLEHSIKEDDIFDPRILFPSDYKSITTIISKESICVQTDDEIIPQKKTIMNDFEVQFNIDLDLVQSIDTENGVFTTCTQTSENSLNIEQISSSISTQTAISIHKSAANEYSREEVQLRKNLIIHKIKNSLNQVKDMYEANSKIIKQIAESAAINKLTQERIKKNEAPINNIKKNEEVVNHLETKVEPEKNVADEAKAQNDEIVVENMKKKVDIVRIKVEDLKRQVGTPDFVFDKRKKEDKPLVEAEVTVNDVKNKELIIQIKNTLNFVTEKFKQNSLIIAEAASIKKEYNVPKNADKNIKQPLKKKDSSSSFQQVLRQLNGSKHVIIKHSQSKIKKKLSKKVTTAMQILKKLNEVMKRMKIQPKESNRKLMEMKQTLIAQLKNLTTENQSMNKFKYSKENITLAPIKNHIHNNKNMVSLNAIRAVSNINSQQLSLSHTYPQTTPSMANIPVEYLPKSRAVGNEAMLHRIMPNVRSKHILKFRDTRDKKKQLYATFGVQNNNKIANAPVVYTRKENPLIAKIVRPIRNTNVEEFLPRLSELSISCVQRFKTEYPRKDHLNIISPAVKESYLSKLLTSEIGCNSILEPLVKCSSKECDQCVANSLNIENKKPSTAPPRSRKDNSFQNNKNFNFKQFMHDPTLKHNVNYTVCPVDVTYNKNPVKNRTQTTTKKSSTTSQSKSTKMNPLSLKNKFNSEENQIQRSIQQAILKNQEKFMLLHAFITDRNTAAKNIAKTSKTSNVVNITPKVSTPLAANKKINTNSKSKQDSKLKNNKKPMNKNKTISPNKNVSSADFFDKKYGNKTSLSSMESNEITPNDKHEYTQGELQNYIAQVEKKFINTFSMKDEEKANAYNNLTLEIEDMLDVLKASGAKETEKESDTSESTLSQKEQIVNNFLTQPKCLISTYSNPTKSTSTLSEPSKHAIEWDKSGAKKKNNKNSGPTIITDHINFKQSLTAIQSKEASLFHVHSTSNCQFIDHVPIIRNCKSDTKIFRPKKIRVNLPSLKIDESEDSLLTSITEEEELSMCNDVTSNESSANTLSFPEIVTELLVEVHFKIVVHFSYICQIAKVTYLVTVWQNVDIELPQEKDTINTRPMTAAYKAKYDIDKFDKISDKDLSIEGESSWDSFESETLRSNKSKDILYLPDSKFEIDVDFIDKYYSSLKLKDLFPDGDQPDEPDEVVIPSTSPKILEFLDMLTSLTKDDDLLPMEIKQNIYYKYNYNKPLISYFCYTYHQINMFEQVSFKMTNQIRFNQGYSSALNFQSNQLRRLIDENQNQRKFKDVRMPRFISVPNCNLYSIATINSDRKFPNRPHLLDANKCFSDTKLNFEFDDKFIKKRKTDSLSQSMFLNSQVSKKKRKINRLMKIAKRAVVNQSAPLLKQNSKLNQNFTYNLSAVNITDISDSLKLVLIFLYVTVFAFVFFCITLNYSCE